MRFDCDYKNDIASLSRLKNETIQNEEKNF